MNATQTTHYHRTSYDIKPKTTTNWIRQTKTTTSIQPQWPLKSTHAWPCKKMTLVNRGTKKKRSTQST